MSPSKSKHPAPSPEHTTDDLLAALMGASRSVQMGGGMTAAEMAQRSGLSIDKVLAALKRIAQQGRLRAGRAPRAAIDGTMRPVPVYTIVDAA